MSAREAKITNYFPAGKKSTTGIVQKYDREKDVFIATMLTSWTQGNLPINLADVEVPTDIVLSNLKEVDDNEAQA